MVLPEGFFNRPVVQVAIDMLGKVLVSRTREGLAAGRIVEVEAYLAKRDAACHASRGKTRGNAAMFGRPGTAYVYPIHSRCCFNAVTQPAGEPSAVLVRAIAPCTGLALMERRRGDVSHLNLARGPARLCEALGIGRAINDYDLTRGRRLWIEENTAIPLTEAVYCSPRIGVTSAIDRYLRFFLKGNPYVSGPRRLAGKKLIVRS